MGHVDRCGESGFDLRPGDTTGVITGGAVIASLAAAPTNREDLHPIG